VAAGGTDVAATDVDDNHLHDAALHPGVPTLRTTTTLSALHRVCVSDQMHQGTDEGDWLSTAMRFARYRSESLVARSLGGGVLSDLRESLSLAKIRH
jgi:hypothetical protein